MSSQPISRQKSEFAEALLTLTNIMEMLRHPETGCPWDLEQTHQTIAPYTIEEAYEVAEAVDKGNPDDIRDELGDLLLQIIFQSQIASEHNHFDFVDVANSISQKMIARHPHIFDKAQANDAAEVREGWEDIKSRERANKGETRQLDGIAATLPAVLQAVKLQSRAARVGFDWPDVEQILDKLHEETREFEAELNTRANGNTPNQAALEDELGDIMFVVINLARKLDINPEQALAKTNRKFRKRFNHIEDQMSKQNKSLTDTSLEEMEYWWQDAKTLP